MAASGWFSSCARADAISPIGLGHQQADILPDRLALEIAELPFRRAREELHDAVAVDDDHRIRDRLQDRLQVPFARAQVLLVPLLPVYVEDDTAETARRSILV